MRIKKAGRAVLAAAALACAAPLGAGAQAAPEAPKVQMSSWEKIKISEAIQSLKFSGDLRLRNDRSDKRPNHVPRNRNRFRLRVGLDAQMPHDVTVSFRLGSGTGEQVSTNQSMDNLSSQKAIWIDTAFLKWSPKLSGAASVSLAGGRMLNPLWRVHSSDVVWDEDFNPEGLAQSLEWRFAVLDLTVFGSAVQGVADEENNSGKNQWFFSEQLGAETALPFKTRLRLAGAYHFWSDANRSSLSQAAVQNGNRRTAAGLLVNKFGVAELTGQLSGKAGTLPLALQGTLIRNVLAKGDPLRQPGTAGTAGVHCAAGETCPTGNDGYQYGLIIGHAKAAGTWELAAFQKYSQTDATVADAADSDFGDGGTNQQGQIYWAAYAPADWMQLKAKYFNVDTIDTQFNPNDKAVRRLQLDCSVKF